MAIFDPNRTADVANASVQGRLAKARGRVPPLKLKAIEELKQQKIHIFNVGPWGQIINTGSTGTYLMPLCPPDKDYVEMLVADANGDMVPPISVIMDELVISSEDSMSRLEEDGYEFAKSMLGLGRGQNPEYALTRFGMFVGEGPKPTKAELLAAKALLLKYCQSVYKQANDLYATDRKQFASVVRPEIHFVAARVLGRDNPQDSPWMTAAAPVGRVKCKMCGRVVDPDVAMCEGGHIVNQELYLAAMAEQEAVQAAVKGK